MIRRLSRTWSWMIRRLSWTWIWMQLFECTLTSSKKFLWCRKWGIPNTYKSHNMVLQFYWNYSPAKISIYVRWCRSVLLKTCGLSFARTFFHFWSCRRCSIKVGQTMWHFQSRWWLGMEGRRMDEKAIVIVCRSLCVNNFACMYDRVEMSFLAVWSQHSGILLWKSKILDNPGSISIAALDLKKVWERT